MAICPLIGGTGQKVKIVDAMAHGVPTVTLAHGARGSPIEHERNGFVARDANEFAHYVRLLWRDQELCATLGAAARETIDRDYSPSNLAGRLRRLLFDPDDDRGFSH
jgi:glycosyltransferase involved in cell wall biosynthesis